MNRISYYFINLLFIINSNTSIASNNSSIDLPTYINETIEMINSMKEFATEAKIAHLEERKAYESLLERVKPETMTFKEFKKIHRAFLKMKTKIDTQSNELHAMNEKIIILHNKIITHSNSDLVRTYQAVLLAQEQADQTMFNEIENSSDDNETLDNNYLEMLIDSAESLLPQSPESSRVSSPLQTHKTIGKRSFAELMQDPNYRYLPDDPREYTLRKNRTQTSHYDDKNEEQRKKELKKLIKLEN